MGYFDSKWLERQVLVYLVAILGVLLGIIGVASLVYVTKSILKLKDVDPEVNKSQFL